MGYGFPFDCPHFIFYQRVKALHGIVNDRLIKNSQLSRLWGPLTKIVEDPQLKKAAMQMQKKVPVFKKLREALSITSQSKQGLQR